MCCTVPPSPIECKVWEGHCFPECKLTNMTNLPGSLSRITRGHTANCKTPPPCEMVKLWMILFFILFWMVWTDLQFLLNNWVLKSLKRNMCTLLNIRIMEQFKPKAVIVWQICLSPGISSDFNTRGWSLGCLKVWKCICFVSFSQWFLMDWQPLQGVTCLWPTAHWDELQPLKATPCWQTGR